ncbi:MAG: hypothetical protein ACKVQC_09910 [Elusimicrobiota bacterium]
MAKLTKYNSFQALKLDVKSSETDPVLTEQRHVEMEAFLELLRQAKVSKKKSNKAHVRQSGQ